MLCVVEEAGEFAGTVRRYMGLARRDGNKQDMQDELADVIISAFIAGANQLNTNSPTHASALYAYSMFHKTHGGHS